MRSKTGHAFKQLLEHVDRRSGLQMHPRQAREKKYNLNINHAQERPHE